MKKYIYHLTSFILVVSMLFSSLSTEAAIQKKKYVFWISPSVVGEYNIKITGATSKPILFQKKSFSSNYVQLNYRNYTYSSAYTYNIRASFKSKGSRAYKIEVYSTKAPSCSFSKNVDKYCISSKLNCSVSWEPNGNSLSPTYGTTGTLTKQIIYLTKEDVIAYSLEIDKNMYLKALRGALTVNQILAMKGLKGTTIGRVITTLGDKTILKIITSFVSTIGGYSAIPDLNSEMVKYLRSASHNYTSGVKVVVTLFRGTLVSNYYTWNGYGNSVIGKEGYRGSFKKSSKVKGWY